ncbi:MAG TPA: glycosyl hydrolase [Opitutaceae bacterium]|nr:glycosyl hydrolase [Opitutaceae bacterium]
MTAHRKLTGLVLSLLLFAASVFAESSSSLASSAPVTPDASPEAVALLKFLRSISGKYTLIGQHNFPSVAARNTDFAAEYTGRMPAVWTSDFGFAEPGDFDSYQARSIVVAEAIRQHKQGAIVSLCWHAVPPTADEPVTFRPLPGADPNQLKSVQGQLTDAQFKDVLTPGTALHEKWEAQVDAIAVFLKQLQDAHVPVLWRPYHEMNGDWFWWGGRTEGEFTTAALYRQIFDRLVNHHHLKNLLWIWSVDRPNKPEMAHEKYFPGIQYLDMLGLDVYGNDFAQAYYDSLVKLSQGKPLALAEVGNPPAPAIMDAQPLWTYYAVWAGMVRGTTRRGYIEAFSANRMLALHDPAYAKASADYRKEIGLRALEPQAALGDFSGAWKLNEGLCTFGEFGATRVPVKLVVKRKGESLDVRSTVPREYADDEVLDATYRLDGTEAKNELFKSERTTIGKVTADGSVIDLESVTALSFGPPGTKLKSHETWSLTEKGDRLVMSIVSDSWRAGEKRIWQTLVFDRE